MCRYIVSIKVDRSDKVINLSCLKKRSKKEKRKRKLDVSTKSAGRGQDRVHWVEVVIAVMAVISAVAWAAVDKSRWWRWRWRVRRGVVHVIYSHGPEEWFGFFSQITVGGQDAWIRVLLECWIGRFCPRMEICLFLLGPIDRNIGNYYTYTSYLYR